MSKKTKYAVIGKIGEGNTRPTLVGVASSDVEADALAEAFIRGSRSLEFTAKNSVFGGLAMLAMDTEPYVVAVPIAPVHAEALKQDDWEGARLAIGTVRGVPAVSYDDEIYEFG